MRFKVIVLLALTSCLSHLLAQDFDVIYSFVNVAPGSGTVSPPPNPQADGLSFSSFTAFGVSEQPEASGRFSFSKWPLGAINGSDDPLVFTGNIGPFSYYEMRLDVSPGYTLTALQMKFTVRRSGTGPRNFTVRTSQDAFAKGVAAGTGTNANIAVFPDNVLFWKYDGLSTSSDQKGCNFLFDLADVTNSLVIRIHAWNAESSGGSFSIDNVEFTGSVHDSVITGINVFNSFLSQPHGWTLFDSEGRKLLSGKEWPPDLSGMKEGLYLLHYQTVKGLRSRKIFLIRQ